MNDTHTPQSQMPTDQIRADRACIGCGFNLFGQSVTKEEHYGLAIARCPECGTIAALQQYPTMTHWVNRFRMIIAAIYILLLLAAFIGSTAAMTGFAFGSSHEASDNLAEYIAQSHAVWNHAQTQPGTAVTTNTIVSYRYYSLEKAYAANELDRALDEFGSLWSNMDRGWFVIMVPAIGVSFAFGVFWSIALLGSSRKQAILIPLISCLIGAAFVIGINRPDVLNSSVRDLAVQMYVPLIAPTVLLIELTAASVGIALGRMFARFAVRLALPPRARVPLSILWTRDGLEIPRP